MRKITAILLALAIAFSLISCSKAKNVGAEGVISPVPKDGDATLTILINPVEYENLTAYEFFGDYLYRFEKDFGVEVEFERIGSSPGQLVELEDREEYIKKLSTRLYAAKGPELIFSQFMPIEPIIKQGAATKLNNKIGNLNKVYEGLLEDDIYFVPISIKEYNRIINLEALKTIGIAEPELNWTSQDFYEIRTKWLKENKVYFNSYEWNVAFNSIIELDKAYDSGINMIALNTSTIKNDIADTREYVFGGNYILNKNYKFENYYRMIFEQDSKESQENLNLFIKNKESGHIQSGMLKNLLFAIDIQNANDINGTVTMPEFSDKEILLEACGFVVNRNARNPELAFEFLNGLLSNDFQMNLYNDSKDGYYPVNKDIESDIKAIEADKVKDEKVLKAKEYALNQIKNGQILFWNAENLVFLDLKEMIEKDLAKIILADKEYSDEELSATLKELENKYNIYLNE